MVSFKVLIVVSSIVSGISAQHVVSKLAETLSNAIVANRHSDYPKASAQNDASRLMGFITSDSRLSAYAESAIKTLDSDNSLFDAKAASEFLSGAGSILTYVTKKPDFYKLAQHVHDVTDKYEYREIMLTAVNELAGYGFKASDKIVAVYATDKDIASLAASLSSDISAVATKVAAKLENQPKQTGKAKAAFEPKNHIVQLPGMGNVMQDQN